MATWDTLSCPACFEVGNPLASTPCGHIVCVQCVSQLNRPFRCPQCREPLSPTVRECVPLTKFVSRLEVKCPECNCIILPKNANQHDEICKKRSCSSCVIC